MFRIAVFTAAAAVGAVSAACVPRGQTPTIAEINGNKFLSPYAGKNITGLTGLVIAKGPSGFFLRSTTPDKKSITSEAIYVFGSASVKAVTVGDVVTLDGRVSEYRSDPTYLYLTEIDLPKNVTVVSSGNTVVPLVIGVDTLSPPTEEYTSLDGGDVFAVPNAVANISAVNPVLEPTKYGLDFWESLSGELVTVKNATVLGRPNSFKETWVVGNWAATGRNEHGGLSMSDKGKI
jgi:hypothetical protein